MQFSRVYLLSFYIAGVTAVLYSQEDNLPKIIGGKIPPNTKSRLGVPLVYSSDGKHCSVRNKT
ncbi:uncharacterized protein PgNI_10022 [Pyricularia grisea]|uniref:Uncharacterized protein n=1 Tax=Pyricularia grisea TaxID=148305 RepID=A0A6P8AS72_PYRGI|nr:uncharacterized protein PgNI_10022 [Pyricularia grisea]TLD04976.1 hypothetical protein PgNI_10022 [Pyricularia grisea]